MKNINSLKINRKKIWEDKKVKKFFLSSDIEGTCGIANWQETNTNNEYSPYFLKQMSKEVAAACNGVLDAGYDEIVVKDAHDSARNIYPDMLPLEAKIIRDWTRSPFSMMAGIDNTFNAAGFTGYHSAASTNGNPLAHTMNLSIDKITINGIVASEFVMNAYAAAYVGVPTVFLSGDKALCESAKVIVPEISTVPVSEGFGGGSTSIHPEKACMLIRETMKKALDDEHVKKCLIKLPDSFEVTVKFRNHEKAFRANYYPGAKEMDETTTYFKATNYLDVLKFFMFTL
jgi:D-amino peptidase